MLTQHILKRTNLEREEPRVQQSEVFQVLTIVRQLMSRRKKLGEFGQQLVVLFSMVTGDSNAQHMMSGQECGDRTQGRNSLS